MEYDVIVIGAGMGGLTGAAKIAKHGKNVLLLEKSPHIGGTSYIFTRQDYVFPMGALSFGYPQKVAEFLEGMDITPEVNFHRSHFQLVSPHLDIRYSVSFDELKKELKRVFPRENKIESFFSRFEGIIEHVKKAYAGPSNSSTQRHLWEYTNTSSADFLAQYFSTEALVNFLGSMGTRPPRMSLSNLALMWNIMAKEGIWFPDCGIHGLAEMIKEAFLRYGGTLRTSSQVSRILIENGSAVGVVCEDGRIHRAAWIISNADYKTTFFELLGREDVPESFLDKLRNTGYTHSELCVYLGVDPGKVDFTAMRAEHLFYRHHIAPPGPSDWEEFSNREMEICRWSDKVPGFVPENKAALVLRIAFPYAHFAQFWKGHKKRKKGYEAYKEKLAWRLVKTAENILPGLVSSVEIFDAATPLTYRDWGGRYEGSIAGWNWGIKDELAPGSDILVTSPIPNLLMAGIYAASELFLGGIPTAMYTGELAANFILEQGDI